MNNSREQSGCQAKQRARNFRLLKAEEAKSDRREEKWRNWPSWGHAGRGGEESSRADEFPKYEVKYQFYREKVAIGAEGGQREPGRARRGNERRGPLGAPAAAIAVEIALKSLK